MCVKMEQARGRERERNRQKKTCGVFSSKFCAGCLKVSVPSPEFLKPLKSTIWLIVEIHPHAHTEYSSVGLKGVG